MSGQDEQERLTQAMRMLDDGLNRIAHAYADAVILLYEDPETFGAGHFVLYPLEGSNARFAIEEQYTGTDWSDDERVPTSWLWRAERIVRRPDGTHDWGLEQHGEAFPQDLPQLLTHVEKWARKTQNMAAQKAQFQSPDRTSRPAPPGRSL